MRRRKVMWTFISVMVQLGIGTGLLFAEGPARIAALSQPTPSVQQTPSKPSDGGGAEPLPVGTILFQSDFSQKGALSEWTGAEEPTARWVQMENAGGCLLVELPAEGGARSYYLRKALPVEKIRGVRLGVECRIRADKVAQPPQSWNGVKCMVHTISPQEPKWYHPSQLWGSFDWRQVGFLVEIPEDATEVWLVLGLENTHGRAWFDDLQVRVVGHRRRKLLERPKTPTQAPPTEAGQPRPVTPGLTPGMILRGAMISPRVSEEDLRVLGGQWKANHVRWQLLWGGFPHGPADQANLPEYEAWLESALQHLDRLLPVCRELGIKVCVDLHTPPGGRDPSSIYRMFQEKHFQEAFVRIWEKIAKRYRDEPAVWGYDLVNEPIEGLVPVGLWDWRTLAEETARRVRAIDPHRAIIVEPVPGGSPAGLDWFEPLEVPGVVYSVHMYIPSRFTHQGIHGNPFNIAYPGKIDGKYWDRSALREALEPVVRYQQDYNVPIYIGEFSAIRWAPGKSGYNYLRDVIEIFEEHGWHWAYHAFREWDGWSVEHGPDPQDRNPVAQPTDRCLLLRSWFEKNQPGRP